MEQILLTSEDIKTLKQEKRLGHIISFILVLIGLLFTVIYSIIKGSSANFMILGIILAAVIFISVLISILINREFNKDLRANTKTIHKRQIDSLRIEDAYEAGSGAMFIPGLGNLFQKLWGQKMRKLKKHIAVANSFEYELSEELYSKVKLGDFLIIHFSVVSAKVLQIDVDEQALI